MQRRSFLKYLGIGAVAAPLLPLVGSAIGPPPAAAEVAAATATNPTITPEEMWPGIKDWWNDAALRRWYDEAKEKNNENATT